VDLATLLLVLGNLRSRQTLRLAAGAKRRRILLDLWEPMTADSLMPGAYLGTWPTAVSPASADVRPSSADVR
jgi:hypothetical protein